MAERCPHSPQHGTGWLEGWRLTFGGEDMSWEGARATVVEDAAERVFVVLYDITELDERVLDHWDGATLDYYRKLHVRVQTLEGDVLAWLYVLNAYEGGLPSARNLGMLADAAEKAGAPADYVTWPARPAVRHARPRGRVPIDDASATRSSTSSGTVMAAMGSQAHCAAGAVSADGGAAAWLAARAACRACCTRSAGRPAVNSAEDRSSAPRPAGHRPYPRGAATAAAQRPRPRGQPRPRLRGRLTPQRGLARRPRGGLHRPAVEDLAALGARGGCTVHPDRVDHVHLDHRRPGHQVVAHRVDHRDPARVGHDLGRQAQAYTTPVIARTSTAVDQGGVIPALYRQVHQNDGGDDEPRPPQDRRTGAAEDLPLAVRVVA